MDIYEKIERLKRLREYLTNELPIFAEQVLATDLIAVVTNRVVQKGENYLGVPFSPYSTNTVAAWRFWGKSRNQKAERKIRALARAKGALSYTEFRGLNNLNTNVKNFEFTGEMWRKFGIVRVNVTGERFKISIGGTTSVAQKKIDENSSREGVSIIEASEAEKTLVETTTKDWIDRQAERILNG